MPYSNSGAAFFRAVLAQFGAGSSGAIQAMASRLNLSPGYLRNVVLGNKRAPPDLRKLALAEFLRNAASGHYAVAMLAAPPADDDAYSPDNVIIHADGFAALLLKYFIQYVIIDYPSDITFRTQDISWAHSKISCEVPAYVAGAFMDIFNFNYDDCVVPTDDGVIHFQCGFSFEDCWVYSLPTSRPSVDILEIAQNEARKIARRHPLRAPPGVLTLDSGLLVTEVKRFQGQWISAAENSASKARRRHDQTCVDFINSNIDSMNNDTRLFRYISEMIVCINWVLFGQVVFGDNNK